MPKRAVVLLSAGLDSTFNLLRACREDGLEVSLALTFDYGQRAAAREVEQASRLASHFGVRHEVVALPWFKIFTTTSLLGTGEVPHAEGVSIDSLDRSRDTAKQVWVPNRNGIFLNVAAGFAEGMDADFVIPGFNIEEAQTFPDNSEAFLKTLDASLAFSTATGVRTLCFTTAIDKTEIVGEGQKLGLPFAKLWPCYLAGVRWCGSCESCQRFRRALMVNGISFADLSAEFLS